MSGSDVGVSSNILDYFESGTIYKYSRFSIIPDFILMS